MTESFYTTKHEQNGRYFADSNFKFILLNNNAWISNKTPKNCVPEGAIDNKSPSVLVMISPNRRQDIT